MLNNISFLRFVAISCNIFGVLWAAQDALAATGVVVLENTPQCDHFVVETQEGYTLLEWFGGVASIWEDDIIFGDIQSYGFNDIYIKDRGEMRVWVENYWASEDDALDFFYSNYGR